MILNPEHYQNARNTHDLCHTIAIVQRIDNLDSDFRSGFICDINFLTTTPSTEGAINTIIQDSYYGDFSYQSR